MPFDRSKYPDDWNDISQRIRERSGWRCECRGECGLHKGRRCTEIDGDQAEFAKGKIVLTVAHLDHDPQNSDADNLRAMCQRCHLRYDVEHHKANSIRTRDRKRRQTRFL